MSDICHSFIFCVYQCIYEYFVLIFENYKCISSIDLCSFLSGHISWVNSCSLTLSVSDYACELAQPIKATKLNETKPLHSIMNCKYSKKILFEYRIVPWSGTSIQKACLSFYKTPVEFTINTTNDPNIKNKKKYSAFLLFL